MDKKSIIRNQFFKLRKKKYFKIGSKFFNPLVKLIKNKTEIKKKIVSIYYPTSYEINVLKILENKFFRNFTILLPVIEERNSMNFYKWKKDDILIINKPKGMVVHPCAGNFENTLANALVYKFKKNLSDINGELRPGIVHRIDKEWYYDTRTHEIIHSHTNLCLDVLQGINADHKNGY